jgi:hypothetical protein
MDFPSEQKTQMDRERDKQRDTQRSMDTKNVYRHGGERKMYRTVYRKSAQGFRIRPSGKSGRSGKAAQASNAAMRSRIAPRPALQIFIQGTLNTIWSFLKRFFIVKPTPV